MKKIIYLLLIPLILLACDDKESYHEGIYFSLSTTSLDFDSNGGSQSIEMYNLEGAPSASILSENSEWCKINVDNNNLSVKVDENILMKSRTAVIKVVSGETDIHLAIRQSRKYFSTIAAVEDLEIVSGPNEVTLTWTEPTEDNFSHVVISYEKRGQLYKIALENGITEYTIKELLNVDGEHTFTLQSVDKENDFGETVSIKAIPGKLIAFRFEKEIGGQFIPYYLKTSDKQVTQINVGSADFDNDVELVVNIQVDESLLATYNKDNKTTYELLPSNAYMFPNQFVYKGSQAFETMDIEINSADLLDQHMYALPLRINPSPTTPLAETMTTVVVLFSVDDLAGWYTVERLEKNGEDKSSYPVAEKDRRRYIKRTGKTTWETGYLFRSYSKDENHTGSGTSVQYISINPDTKKIFIKQNGYETAEDKNVFDLDKNELTIEFLYKAWSGWWSHEKMFNRSLNR